jgi:exodeoxyribonuclease-3
MKIVTWNINSIKVRIKQLYDFLARDKPDIILLQEIKCETDKFPYELLSDLNYNCYVNGQKSWNGVAILSKYRADEISCDFTDNHCSSEARFIEIAVQTPIGFCRVISLYAPNGGEVDSDKFIRKLKFYDDLTKYLESKKEWGMKLFIGGDFNIAPFDIDVYSPKELLNTTCFTLIERQKLRTILNLGFYDLYRLARPDQQEFSWFEYKGGALQQNKGMRIDRILASSNAANNLHDSFMLYPMRTVEKPSDHVPVVAVLKDGIHLSANE